MTKTTLAADLRRARKLLGERPDLVVRLLTIAGESARDATAPVLTAADAAEAFGQTFWGLPDEELHCLYLDRRNRVIARERLTIGSDRFTVVDPRQIFRPAVTHRASAIVLAHNHPSGDPTPSVQDGEVTRRTSVAGRVLGVTVLDHLVFGASRWVSMRDAGLMSEDLGSTYLTWTA
jgi:DNA repair protein RadC